MKKRVFGLALVAAFAIGAIGGPAVAAPAPKVDICHFAGHVGPGGTDYLFFQFPGAPGPGQIAACEARGGVAIEVSGNAIGKGHPIRGGR